MSAPLTPTERVLIGVSAALAARDRTRLLAAMEEADATATAAEVEEIILQGYLFLGYPIALNAFVLWREVSGSPAGNASMEDQSVWPERGRHVCRTVYGGQYEGLRANVRRLHPDMERWMVEEGYGKVLGRPGVPLRVRELCIAGLLAVLDTPRQLFSHLRGALNAGAESDAVDAALSLALEHASDEARTRALETWAAVRSRNGSED